MQHSFRSLVAALVLGPSPVHAEFSRDPAHALVCAVLAQNQSLAAAEAAWRTAEAQVRAPTAVGPTRVAWSFAPWSFAPTVPFGHVLELEQSFRLGQARVEQELGHATATAARLRGEAVRNELALATFELVAAHSEIRRALRSNAEHRELVQELIVTARSRYAAGFVPAQDPLQVELELDRLERERIDLEADRTVVVAQLNGLLHRAPADALPELPEPGALPTREARELDPQALRDEAFGARPELGEAAAAIAIGEHELRLSRRRFAPELEVMASYNSMWIDPQHRFMLGVGIQVPLQLGALRAGVNAAEAGQQRARSEERAVSDRVAVEVEEARARLLAGRERAQLLATRTLPTARTRVEVARVGYETGANDLQALIDAERELRSLELEHHHAIAELERSAARLDRALGRRPDCTRTQGARP